MTQSKIPTTSSLKRDASGTEVPSVEALAKQTIKEGLVNPGMVDGEARWDDGWNAGLRDGVNGFERALRRRDARVVALLRYLNEGKAKELLMFQKRELLIDYIINSHVPPLTEKEIEEAGNV